MVKKKDEMCDLDVVEEAGGVGRRGAFRVGRFHVEMGEGDVDAVAQRCHDGPRAVALVRVGVREIGTLDHPRRPLQLRVAHYPIINSIDSIHMILLSN